MSLPTHINGLHIVAAAKNVVGIIIDLIFQI